MVVVRRQALQAYVAHACCCVWPRQAHKRVGTQHIPMKPTASCSTQHPARGRTCAYLPQLIRTAARTRVPFLSCWQSGHQLHTQEVPAPLAQGNHRLYVPAQRYCACWLWGASTLWAGQDTQPLHAQQSLGLKKGEETATARHAHCAAGHTPTLSKEEQVLWQ